jgi:hypothetical protein
MTLEERIEALADHLELTGDEWNDITEGYDETHLEYGNQGYLVVTDNEANEIWEEYLESYFDDCIMPELSEFAARYFSLEAWKRDARHDGRGHCLSPYDGCEHDGINGLFIYRTN